MHACKTHSKRHDETGMFRCKMVCTYESTKTSPIYNVMECGPRLRFVSLAKLQISTPEGKDLASARLTIMWFASHGATFK
jgi:hypothetical protein